MSVTVAENAMNKENLLSGVDDLQVLHGATIGNVINTFVF